jgi:hypothetical protein
LSKIRFALGGNGLLRQAAARSFLAHTCKTQKPAQPTERPIGLDNVGFIAVTPKGALAQTRISHIKSTKDTKTNDQGRLSVCVTIASRSGSESETISCKFGTFDSPFDYAQAGSLNARESIFADSVFVSFVILLCNFEMGNTP